MYGLLGVGRYRRGCIEYDKLAVNRSKILLPAEQRVASDRDRVKFSPEIGYRVRPWLSVFIVWLLLSVGDPESSRIADAMDTHG
ncbi:unnamed protein product [Protopolystoma xenopodis]|uniref:Uncharacterized protein n=1 Tax=Protopolystoma xenopodis TaxID=117903 RepID=A0A448XBP8_9PLAT|nr:unnamed protein product [Protopolystoma xenopodis]